jgi:hypothetical protein
VLPCLSPKAVLVFDPKVAFVKTSQSEATYALLIEYASQQALRQEFTATQDAISQWTGIPVRTLRRHTAILGSQGKLSTRYTGDGIVYSLPDGVVKVQTIREVPTGIPGEFILEDAGLEVQSGNADPGYKPAKWSNAWTRFFAACSDYSNDLVDDMVFNHNCEPAGRSSSAYAGYAGALPF